MTITTGGIRRALPGLSQPVSRLASKPSHARLQFPSPPGLVANQNGSALHHSSRVTPTTALKWQGMAESARAAAARASRRAECWTRLRALDKRVLMLLATCSAAGAVGAADSDQGDAGRGGEAGDSPDNAASPPPPPEPAPPPPEVVAPPRDQESVAVQEGDDVTLTLLIAGGEPTDIYWSRNDRRLLGERFHVARKEGHTVQLSLTRVSRDDSGRYTLTASNSSGESRAGYDLRVDSRMSMSDSLSVPSAPTHDDAPHFLRSLADLAVKVGTRTRFLVEIRSPSDLKVTWLRNDRPVKETDRFQFLNEGNFWCVDVGPVMVEDHGRWTCVAENDAGRSACACQLSVLVPKAYKGPEFLEELRALLTEQGTVSLECKVVGVPTPALRWYKDAKEIRAGDVFALTADASDPTSLGTYTCEAVNCMGRAYSSSRVHVVGRGSREGSLKPADCLLPTGPPPTFDEEINHEKARIGDSLTLSCHVQVPPWPKSIQWYNSEGRVETGDRYRILEDGLGGYSVEISALEASDDGEWKCVATSFEGVRGISTAAVTLTYPKNYRKPRFLESLRAILTEEGLVSFECKVVGFPTPQLRWFKDGQELRPGDVYQLTGTNSLGSYCCIARNCMGEASSTAELTVEDIQSQLSEEERLSLFSSDSVPHFVRGLRSQEARVGDNFRFTVQVSVAPEPKLEWFRDDDPVLEGDKFRVTRENLGTCHLDIRPIDINDQAEWKCVATNDFGHSVTSCFLKLTIPKHFKKPRFLECLRAVLSEEGAVNLECKVIGVPQPVLKWYKDGEELKPGDIHRIISGQDGTCCLGTYTCEATNCMGTVSSSASLVGFEERGSPKSAATRAPHPIVRDPSLSTIHEERTSQMYDAEQSLSLDERGEVSFSFDGKEVSVSLYETPDLTEEEALQVVEMYADELSEHISEHNIVELPPLRFMKESSTSGNLLMEAVLVDVSPDYFGPAGEEDLRTDADMDEFSISDEAMTLHTPNEDEEKSERLDSEEIFDRALEPLARPGLSTDESPPKRPPRKTRKDLTDSKSGSKSIEDQSDSFSDAKGHSLEMDTSYKSAQENVEKSSDENNSGKAPKRKSSTSDDSVSKLRKADSVKLQKTPGGKDSNSKAETQNPEGNASKLGKRGRTVSVDSNSVSEGDTLYEENIPKRPQLASGDAVVPEYQTGQISVLESLSHSLQSIQNGLLLVENQVASQSIDNKSAKESFEILDDLSQSLQEIQRGLNLIEKQIDEESILSPGHKEMSILETLAQPLQEFQHKLALVEQQSVLGGTEETLLERTTHSIMESVSQPMQEFQRELGLIHQRAALGMGEDFVTERLQILCVPSGRNSTGDGESLPKSPVLDNTDAKIKASLSLQTLAEPVTELLNALDKFQSDVMKFDEGDILSDKPKFSSLEKLLYPMKVLRSEIELIEQQAITEVDDKMHHGKSLSILEAVSQPMDDLRRGISLVEQQAVMDAGQEFCSASVLENLEKPIRRLKRGLNQIQQQVSLEASLESIPQSYEISVLQGLEISLHNLKRVLSALQKKCAAQQSEEVFHLFEICTLFDPLDNLSHGVTRASENILTDSTESSPKPSIASLDCLASPLNELNKSLLQLEDRFFPMTDHETANDEKSVAELVQSPLKALRDALGKAGIEVGLDQSTNEVLSPETTPGLQILMPAIKNLETYLETLLNQLRRPKETDEVSLAESLETLQSLFKCAYEVENSVSQIRRLAMKKVPVDKTGALVLGSLKEPFHELGTKLIEKQQGLLLQPGDLTLFVKPLDVDLQTMFPQFDLVCEALNDVKLYASHQDSNATSGKHYIDLKLLQDPITELVQEVLKARSDIANTSANSTNYPLLKNLVPPMQKLTAALLKIEVAYSQIIGPAGVPSEIYVEAMKQTSTTIRSLFEHISLLPEPGFEGIQSRELKNACLNLIQPLAGIEFLVQRLSTDLETDIKSTSLHNSLTQISKAFSNLSNEINATTNELEDKLKESTPMQVEIVHTILSSFCDVQRAIRAAQVQIAMESGEEDLGSSQTPKRFGEMNDALRDLKSNLQSFEIASSAKSKEIVLSHVQEIDCCISNIIGRIDAIPDAQADFQSPFADLNSILRSVHQLKLHFSSLQTFLKAIASNLVSVPEGQPAVDQESTMKFVENLKETSLKLGKISSLIISSQGHVPQSAALEKLLHTANELRNQMSTLENAIKTKVESGTTFSCSEASYLCTLLAPAKEFGNGIEQIAKFSEAMDQSSVSVPQLHNLQDSVCELQVALDSFKSLVPADALKSPGSQIIFESLSEPLRQLNKGLFNICEANGQRGTVVSNSLLRASVAQPLAEMISALEYETERLTHIVDSFVPETDRDIKKSQITLPVEGFKAKIKNMHTSVQSSSQSDGDNQVAAIIGLTQCVREFRQLAGAVQSEIAKMCEPIQISNKGSLPLLQNLQQIVHELQKEATSAVSVATMHIEDTLVPLKESAVLLSQIISPVSDFLQSLSEFENVIVSENDMVPLSKCSASRSLVEPLSSMKQVLLNVGQEISENATHENIAIFSKPIQDLQRGIALIEEEIFMYSDDSLTIKDGVSILDTLSQPIQTMKKEVAKFQTNLIKKSGVPEQQVTGTVPSFKICSSMLEKLENTITDSEKTVLEKSRLPAALFAACNALCCDVLDPIRGACYWIGYIANKKTNGEEISKEEMEMLKKPLEDLSTALLKVCNNIELKIKDNEFESVQNVLAGLKLMQKNVATINGLFVSCPDDANPKNAAVLLEMVALNANTLQEKVKTMLQLAQEIQTTAFLKENREAAVQSLSRATQTALNAVQKTMPALDETTSLAFTEINRGLTDFLQVATLLGDKEKNKQTASAYSVVLQTLTNVLKNTEKNVLSGSSSQNEALIDAVKQLEWSLKLIHEDIVADSSAAHMSPARDEFVLKTISESLYEFSDKLSRLKHNMADKTKNKPELHSASEITIEKVCKSIEEMQKAVSTPENTAGIKESYIESINSAVQLLTSPLGALWNGMQQVKEATQGSIPMLESSVLIQPICLLKDAIVAVSQQLSQSHECPDAAQVLEPSIKSIQAAVLQLEDSKLTNTNSLENNTELLRAIVAPLEELTENVAQLKTAASMNEIAQDISKCVFDIHSEVKAAKMQLTSNHSQPQIMVVMALEGLEAPLNAISGELVLAAQKANQIYKTPEVASVMLVPALQDLSEKITTVKNQLPAFGKEESLLQPIEKIQDLVFDLQKRCEERKAATDVQVLEVVAESLHWLRDETKMVLSSLQDSRPSTEETADTGAIIPDYKTAGAAALSLEKIVLACHDLSGSNIQEIETIITNLTSLVKCATEQETTNQNKFTEEETRKLLWALKSTEDAVCRLPEDKIRINAVCEILRELQATVMNLNCSTECKRLEHTILSIGSSLDSLKICLNVTDLRRENTTKCICEMQVILEPVENLSNQFAFASIEDLPPLDKICRPVQDLKSSVNTAKGKIFALKEEGIKIAAEFLKPLQDLELSLQTIEEDYMRKSARGDSPERITETIIKALSQPLDLFQSLISRAKKVEALEVSVEMHAPLVQKITDHVENIKADINQVVNAMTSNERPDVIAAVHAMQTLEHPLQSLVTAITQVEDHKGSQDEAVQKVVKPLHELNKSLAVAQSLIVAGHDEETCLDSLLRNPIETMHSAVFITEEAAKNSAATGEHPLIIQDTILESLENPLYELQTAIVKVKEEIAKMTDNKSNTSKLEKDSQSDSHALEEKENVKQVQPLTSEITEPGPNATSSAIQEHLTEVPHPAVKMSKDVEETGVAANLQSAEQSIASFVENATGSICRLEEEISVATESLEIGAALDPADVVSLQIFETPLTQLKTYLNDLKENVVRIQAEQPQELRTADVRKPLESLQRSLQTASASTTDYSSDLDKCQEMGASTNALQTAICKIIEETKTLEDPTVLNSLVIEALSEPLKQYTKQIIEIKSTKSAQHAETLKVKEEVVQNATLINNEVSKLLSLPTKSISFDQENAPKASHVVINSLAKPLQALQLVVEKAKSEMQEDNVVQKVTVQDLSIPLQNVASILDRSKGEIQSNNDILRVDDALEVVVHELTNISKQINQNSRDTSLTHILEEIVSPLSSLSALMTSVVAKEVLNDKLRGMSIVTGVIQEIKDMAAQNYVSDLQENELKDGPISATTLLLEVSDPLSNLQAIIEKNIVEANATAEEVQESPLEIVEALKPIEESLASLHQQVVQSNSYNESEAVAMLQALENLQVSISTAEQSLQNDRLSPNVQNETVFVDLAEGLSKFTDEVQHVKELKENAFHQDALNNLKTVVSRAADQTKDPIPLINQGPLQVKSIRHIKCFAPLQNPCKNLTELLQRIEKTPHLITLNPQDQILSSELQNILLVLSAAESEVNEAPNELQGLKVAVSTALKSLAIAEEILRSGNTWSAIESITTALSKFGADVKTSTEEQENKTAMELSTSTLLALDEIASISNESVNETNGKLGLQATVLHPLNNSLEKLQTAIREVREICHGAVKTVSKDTGLLETMSDLKESLATTEQFLMDQTIESLGDLASLVVPLHDLQTAIKSIVKDTAVQPSAQDLKKATTKFAGPFIEFSKIITNLKKAEDSAHLAEVLKTTDLEHASLVDCAVNTMKEVNEDMTEILSPSRDLKKHFMEAFVLDELFSPIKDLDNAILTMKEVDTNLNNRVEVLLTPLQNLVCLVSDMKDDLDSKTQEERLLIHDLIVPLSQLSWSVTFIEENAVLKREIGENPVVIENTILKSILEPLAEFKSKINKVKGKLQSKIRAKCELANSLINTIDAFTNRVQSLDKNKGQNLNKVTLPFKDLRDGAVKIKEDIHQEASAGAREIRQLVKPVQEVVSLLNDIGKSLAETQESSMPDVSESFNKLSAALSHINKDVAVLVKAGEKPWNVEDKLMDTVQNALKSFIKSVENLESPQQQTAMTEAIPIQEAAVFSNKLPENAVACLVSATEELTKELARLEVNVMGPAFAVEEMPMKTRQTVLESLQEPSKELNVAICKVAQLLANDENVTEDQVKDVAARIRVLHENLEEIEQEVVLEQIKEGAVNLSMLQAIIRPIEQLNTCVALIEESQVYEMPQESADENETLNFSVVSQPVKELSQCLAVVEEAIAQDHAEVNPDQQVLFALANPLQELKSGLELIAKAEQAESTEVMQDLHVEQLLKLAKPIQEIQVAILTVDNQEEHEVKQLDGNTNTALLKALAEPLQVLGHKIAVIEHQQVMEANICSESGTDISKHSTVVSVVEIAPQGQQAIIQKQVLLEADGGSLENSSSIELQQANATDVSLRAVGIIEVQDTVEAEGSLKISQKKPHDQVDTKNASDSLGIAVYADSGVLMSSRRDDSSSDMHDEPETLSDIESIPDYSKPDTPKQLEDASDNDDSIKTIGVVQSKQEDVQKSTQEEPNLKDASQKKPEEKEEETDAEESTKVESEATADTHQKPKLEEKQGLIRAEEENRTTDEKVQVEEKPQNEAEETAKVKEKQNLKEAAEKKKADEEKKMKEADNKAKADAEAKARKETEEKAKLEEEQQLKEDAEKKKVEEEKKKKEADDKAKVEAEAKAKKEAEEKAKLEEEQKLKEAAEKKKAADQAKSEAEAKAKKEAEDKLKLEEEQKLKEATEKKKAEEEKKKKEADDKAKAEAEAKAKKEAEEKAKLEEEQKLKEAAEKKKADDQAKAEAEAKAKKEALDKLKQEEEQKLKEAAEKKKAEEGKKKKEADDKAKAEAEAKAKKEAEEKAKLEEEQKLKEATEKKKVEEEKKKKEADDKAKVDAEAKAKKEAEEKAKLEEEQKLKEAAEKKKVEEQRKKEADDKAKAEAEAKAKKEAEEKAKLEEEKKLKEAAEKKKAADQAKSEAEAKAKKEAEDELKLEEEQKLKEAAEKKKAEEEKKQKEADDKAKADAEAKAKNEAEEKAKLEEEQKLKEAAEKKKAEEEKKEKEANDKAKAEAEAKAKKEAEEKAKLAEEQKLKEAAEKKKAEEEKKKKEADNKAKAEAEAKAKKEAEEKAKLEEEQKLKEAAEKKKVEEEKKKKEADDKAKAEAEAKAKKEAEEKAKLEEEQKLKEAAEKKKVEEEKKKKEADDKAKAEAEAKAKKEAEEKAKLEEEQKLKEAAEKKKVEEEKKKKEADDKAKAEAEAKAKKEAEDKAKLEEEQKLKEAAEKKKVEEEKKKKEADDKAKAEAEAKAKKEAEEKAKLEEEQKLKEAAEKKKVEEEKKKKEADDKAKAEAEAKAKKEAEEKAKLEEEQKLKEAAEKKKVEEEKKKKEADDKAKAEAEAKAKKEAEEKAKLEEEQKLKEAAEKKKVEEEKKKKEADDKAKAEAEAKAKKEAEEKAKLEEEQKLKEAAEKKKVEEEKKKKEADDKAKAEAESKAKKEAEEKAKLEEEQKLKEAAEKKKVEEEKKKKEADDKAKAEAEAKAKKEAEEKAKLEEEQKLKEAAEKKKGEEEKKKKETDDKAKAEAEAKAKKEAEENAKLEEEQKIKDAAEKKKVEEEKKKNEADDKAKAEAESKAKKEAEEKSRLEEEKKLEEAAEKKKAEEEKKKKEDHVKAKADTEAKVKKESEKKAKLEEEQKLKVSVEEKKPEVGNKMKEGDDKSKGKKEAEENSKLLVKQKLMVAAEQNKIEEKKKQINAVDESTVEAELKSNIDEAKIKKAMDEKTLADTVLERPLGKRVLSSSEKSSTRPVSTGFYTRDAVDRDRKRHEDETERRNAERHEDDAARRRKQRLEDAEKFQRDMDILEERQKRIQEDRMRVEELSSRLMKEEADRRSRNAWGISEDAASLSTRYTSTTSAAYTPSYSRASYERDVGKGRSRSSHVFRTPGDDSLYGRGRSRTPDYYTSPYTPLRRPDLSPSYESLRKSTWSSTSALDRRGRSSERALEDLRLGTAHLYEEGRKLARSVTPSPMRGRSAGVSSASRFSRLSYDDLRGSDGFNIERRSRAMERRLRPMFCARLSDRAVSKGCRVRLACSVLGTADLRVTWCKDGFPLFSQAGVVTKEVDGLCTLEIPAAEVSDSGVYSCAARDRNGEATTSCTLTVFGDASPAPRPPIFLRPVQEWYRPSVDELTLETRVSAHPMPRVTWLLNGAPLRVSDRYEQQQLSDGTCRLIVRGPDPSADSGRYTCRAANLVSTDHVAHTVHFTGRESYESRGKSPVPSRCTPLREARETRQPRFSSSLVDSQVPCGGTLALQVQVTGYPRPRLEWLLGSEPLPRTSSRYRLLEDGSVHTLLVSGATAKDAGQYTVRAVNPHGSTDTSARVDVVSHSGAGAHGDPAMFLSRPETLITVAHGEDITVSFRLGGDPKPKVTWMKGTRDITNSGRTIRETVGDYVRLTLKRAILSDAGTYFIVAKNIFGTDRAFFTVQFRQRARSLTPGRHRRDSLGDDSWEHGGGWSACSSSNLDDTSQILRDIHERSKTRREVPGPIAGEPVITDSGRNCVTLSWPKPLHSGDAPVLAYRVEAWRLGSEGGARWRELGISPTNAYDAFGLVAGKDYRLRITPRNRHGWGEPLVSAPLHVELAAPVLPEFTRPLPGQVKALRGQDITVDCQVRGDPSPETRWSLDSEPLAEDGRLTTTREGGLCRLAIRGVREEDAGRYCCEATNAAGRVSTFVRLTVVTDPQLLHADTKLRRDFKGAEIT